MRRANEGLLERSFGECPTEPARCVSNEAGERGVLLWGQGDSQGGILMDFLQFVNEVKKGLTEYFKDSAEVTVSNVRKNNGVMLTGVVIMKKDSHIAPTIYLESFYEAYKKGMGLREILSQIEVIYEKNRVQGSEDSLEFFQSFLKVRKKIFYKLINAEKNRELLREIPSVPYLDLAIVFYCDCSSELFGNAAILIKNSHLKMWGVDKEQLYLAAAANTPKSSPYEIKTMEAVMKEMFAEEIRKELERKHISYSEAWLEEMAAQMLADSEPPEGKTPMYVLTNVKRCNGASCVLYERVLENFAKKMNDNLYILPSSIHEMIMIPASFAAKASELREMVEEINATQVEDEEVLSDSVYFFNRMTKQLELA